MKFSVLASGSSGNCYCLESDNDVLILECGIPFLEIKKHLNFNTHNIRSVICSHEHFD